MSILKKAKDRFLGVIGAVFVGLPEFFFGIAETKVQRWYTAMEGWGEEDVRVVVCLADDAWYWALLDFLWMEVQSPVCNLLQGIPLPGPLVRWKRNWRGAKEIDTFGNFYGDSVGDLWHILVCDPGLQLIWPHLGVNEVQFELTLAEARVRFANFPKQYQWVEEELEKHKEYDAEKATEEAKAKG